jgi:hypothetical protein
MADDFVIPAEADSQTLPQLIDFKAKPLDPGLRRGDSTGFFALMWEFQSFFITLIDDISQYQA